MSKLKKTKLRELMSELPLILKIDKILSQIGLGIGLAHLLVLLSLNQVSSI